MADDAYCLFIIVACLLTLAVPAEGQVVVAVFAFVLAVLARLAPNAERPDHGAPRDRRDLAGR